MLGVWLEDGSVRLRDDLPDPRPGPREALVAVSLAGICGTDLELIGGYLPFRGILGHEFVGVVEEGPPEWLGRRVVGEINVTCRGRGEPAPCRQCSAGRAAHCERREVVGIRARDGVFAERACLPTANLHRIPEGLDDETAVFAEPLAAALRVREQVDVRPGERVLVVGSGRLGQLVARGLASTGCRLAVAGHHRRQLALVEPLGARTYGGEADGEAATIPERSFDIAVDCTGATEGFEVARRALRPGGTLVLKSTYAGRLELDPSALVVDEMRIVGSRCGSFEAALRCLAQGRVDPRPLVDARFPLREAVAALERAAAPGALKLLLEVRDGAPDG